MPSYGTDFFLCPWIEMSGHVVFGCSLTFYIQLNPSAAGVRFADFTQEPDGNFSSWQKSA